MDAGLSPAHRFTQGGMWWSRGRLALTPHHGQGVQSPSTPSGLLEGTGSRQGRGEGRQKHPIPREALECRRPGCLRPGQEVTVHLVSYQGHQPQETSMGGTDELMHFSAGQHVEI